MTPTNSPEERLYKLALGWQKSVRNPLNATDYVRLVKEICFHGVCRYVDYNPTREEDDFVVRLAKWLDNVHAMGQKQALLKAAALLIFIDGKQTHSLARDAYRRIILPWARRGSVTREQLLTADRADDIDLLKQFAFYSVTESLNFPDFLSVNRLAGLPKPRMFGENPTLVSSVLSQAHQQHGGIVVLEDFVGTGNQAAKILREVVRCTNDQTPILFVPFVMLEDGLKTFATPDLQAIEVRPVVIIPASLCIRPQWNPGEPAEYAVIRSLIDLTATRVIEKLDRHDKPPKSAYGYENSGALVVTAHNTPNNTLTLIHHQAPSWSPLFRRLHHGS